MKFLGGFLKFLGFFVLLLGAIACTALCVFGIMEELWEPCLVGGLVFLSCLFVSLGILGTGIALKQIVKLKKKVEQLEQRLWYASAAAAPVTPVTAETAVAPEQPVPAAEPMPTSVSEPVVASAKAPNKTKLIAIIASAVAVVAIILVVVLASGGKAEQQVPALREEDMQQAVELPPVEMVEPEPTEAPAEIEVVELPMGSALSTDFVEMTFDEVVVQEDIKKSVTIDNVTHITGPEPLPGQTYICLSGRIKGITNTELPVYDFFLGRFQIGDYSYEVSANDCDILSPDGTTESTIDPLLEYEYRIYTAIPLELLEVIAAGEACSFTFGFYDMFDNWELSANRAFMEDPIAECPYQYTIPFTPIW